MASLKRHVAFVGTGLIGRAWAAIFARAGWKARLSDPHIPTLKAAPRLIRDELHALARHGLADDPDAAVARISVAGSLREAVMDVEFVQENGPEKVEDKRAIFAQLDIRADHAVWPDLARCRHSCPRIDDGGGMNFHD